MKVKVKIAVAANADGHWNAYGWHGCESWGETMDAFDALENEHRFWIEAEVDVPDSEQVVAGKATVAVE